MLVGGSGSGKSTILRMLAGLESVTSGAIHIGDRDVTALPPRERDVAMVFQDYALYPHMTVRENLSIGLRLRKFATSEIERRVGWAADILGLAPLLDRKPKALSGGQRQRVAMGRAMVREPAVFLFDEPLSNLDAGLRAQMRIEIGALQRRLRTTTVYVTHDQVEAMTLGDRIVVLAGGRIQQIGRPIELYREPINRFVADTDAAARTVHEHRFTRSRERLHEERPPGSRVGNAHRGTLLIRKRVGQGDDRRFVAHGTLRTCALHGVRVDAIALRESRDTRPDRLDDSSEILPRYVRQIRLARVEPRTDVGVDGIDADGLDADEDLARSGRRIGDVLELHHFGRAEFARDDRFHMRDSIVTRIVKSRIPNPELQIPTPNPNLGLRI